MSNRDRYVLDHLRLASSIAKTFWRTLGDDALGIAHLALVVAAERFDHTRGVRFSTYAYVCIRRTLLRAAYRRRGINRQEKQFPRDRENPDRDLSQLVPAPERAPPDRSVRGAADKIDALIRRLPAAHRRIVELKFGLVDGRPRSLKRVAAELGISRERVRQILAVSLSKMRPSE